MQKKVIAVHDISCVGRCSLTVALPIISAAGVECSIIPTALLSTHTAGFEGYTFLSLTEEMEKIAAHLKTLGRPADTVYTGYLGSPDQVGVAKFTATELLREGGIAVVDPVMGDNGKLYPGFDDRMVAAMRELCSVATVIIPNITEASFLLEKECPADAPKPGEATEELLRELATLGAPLVVLTGIQTDDGKIGAAYYDSRTGKMGYALTDLYPGFYHGTGDVFGSAFSAAIAMGADVDGAAAVAVEFTADVVKRTAEEGDEKRYGPVFEPCLAGLSATIAKHVK